MKLILVIACCLTVAGAITVYLKENEMKCRLDCDLEVGKIVSTATDCSSYLECQNSSVIMQDCSNGKRFDDELKRCVRPKQGETRICHPCAGYPTFVEERLHSNCPITCGPNEVKNISHSIDCKAYVECRNENWITFLDCPDGYRFSDDAKACIQPAEGSGPTCHPCFM